MNLTEMRAQQMARKRRPSEDAPPTVPIKVDRAIAAKAKMIASDQGIDLAKYVSDALRGIVERDWSRMIKRVDSSGGE